ncbi:sensor histidine kinase [Kitasatospora sp. McL0602]|uniref:sensor histidine kinase n=1 Tax=Kitasatospora sp. McL0602 TaxID=3439530 RepID=UPI003F8BE28A
MADSLGEALRALPRTLREDLLTGAADPLPLEGRRRGPGRRQWAVVAQMLGAAVLCAVNLGRFTGGFGLSTELATMLALLQSAAFVLAFSRPVLAWWVSIGVTILGAQSAHYTGDFVLLPWVGVGGLVQVAVLFLVALYLRPRIAVEVLVISILVGTACEFTHEGRQDTPMAIVLLSIVTVVGTSLRGRRVARSQLVVQEELTAEERARRTVLEERTRIARELHDVVAHHMSVISIQAQVARHLAENPSEELTENLVSIRQNAVEALAELRRVLGVLRSEDALPDAARHAPQPTLERLGELIANVRGAGVAVTVGTTGEPGGLPPGVELSAFRIVQEALSNAMRHAPGTEVRVELGYRPTGVTIRVTNSAPDHPAPPSTGAGHGLLGMRERASTLGGQLATGATPEGGWEVVAILPTQPAATTVKDSS